MSMKIKNFAAAVALTITTLGVTAGTVTAAPPPPKAPDGPANTTLQTDVLPGIHYTASVVDRSIVIRTDAGSLTTQGNTFQVLDNQRRLVAGVALTYQRDGQQWPIAAKIDGNTATLTPVTGKAAARPVGARPVDAKADFDDALSIASTQIGLGISIGALVGTVIGAGAGCVAGAVVGAALMPPLFLPGAAGGCLAGIAAGSALGVVAGTIIVGVPVTVVSAIQFFNVINSPPAAAPAPVG